MRNRLSRRTVLRGAGGIAIALPWLEAMEPERAARAAAAPAKKLIGVFTPGGTVLSNWRPSGTEVDFELSPILAPLAPVKPSVLVADGIDMTCAVGDQDQSGLVGLWTGTPQVDGVKGYATGPSIDQVLASRLSVGQRLESLPLAVRWGTGRSRGLVSPMNIANYAATPTWDPIPPRLDPAEVWQDLFGELTGGPGAAWDKSILDSVGARYAKLAGRVGAEDRARLERHLEQIRSMEVRLVAASGCSKPELVDTAGYNPRAGLNSAPDGSIKDPQTDAAIPQVGQLMMDMMVMALACDLTSVTTLMWGDSEAQYTFPWLELPETLAYYMNDGGYHPDECTKIFTWYVKQHAYLLQRLAEVPTATGTLLTDSVVFIGSNLQDPATHAKTDMPFLLAGGGGGLRTGRWMKNDHRSHNDLLVSLLNLFGDERQTFGASRYCTGPLGGLT